MHSPHLPLPDCGGAGLTSPCCSPRFPLTRLHLTVGAIYDTGASARTSARVWRFLYRPRLSVSERQTVLFVLSSSLEVYGLEGHATGASASRTRLRISPPPPSSADTRVQAHACVPGAAFRWARRARDSALTRRARHHDLFPYVPLKEDKAGKIVPTPNYLGILNFLHSLWLPPPLLTLMPVQGPARFSPL